jgi:hypothetical protein
MDKWNKGEICLKYSFNHVLQKISKTIPCGRKVERVVSDWSRNPSSKSKPKNAASLSGGHFPEQLEAYLSAGYEIKGLLSKIVQYLLKADSVVCIRNVLNLE